MQIIRVIVSGLVRTLVVPTLMEFTTKQDFNTFRIVKHTVHYPPECKLKLFSLANLINLKYRDSNRVVIITIYADGYFGSKTKLPFYDLSGTERILCSILIQSRND